MTKEMELSKEQLIQGWIDKIKSECLPAFSESVQQLSQLANEDEADLEELSKLIKRDAALSTKILRASNGVYRQRRGRTNTISRAIVMLGVKEVKKICLTCSLIEGLSEGNPPSELTDEMAHAFHAATQARLLAIVRGDPYSEEVFLSAMMLNIGPLAIWKVAENEMREVKEIVTNEGCALDEAEHRVFGFTLAELSRALTFEWSLNEFIPITENPTENERKRHDEITLSTSLSRSLAYGWESAPVEKVLLKMEDTLTIAPDAIVACIRDASNEMVEMSASFGINPPLEPISVVPENATRPTTIRTIEEAAPEPSESQQSECEEEEEYIPVQPNQSFQLESLRNLSALMASRAKPTMYVLHAIGGMHRGVGLDRVLFGILNDSRTILSARLAVGPKNKEVRENFVFDVSPEIESLFTLAFQRNIPIWPGADAKKGKLFSGAEVLYERLQCSDFFLAPVVVSQKWVGVFYADMQPSGRPLTAELFDSFNQFAVQATLAFQHFEFAKGGGTPEKSSI